MSNKQSGPANLNAPSNAGEQETIFANGISADTGQPIAAPLDSIARQARNESPSPEERQVAKSKEATAETFGVEFDVDPSKLEEAGWGVIFPATASAELLQSLKQALKPLLDRRSQQAGKLFRTFENADGYQPGEACKDWLDRHGVSQSVVSPSMGVPYYLMIVGSPEEIPFEFQYQLDIFWAVGRLYFDDLCDYRCYAQSVVAYETADKIATRKSAAIFSTAHDFDRATQMFANFVATPLANGDKFKEPIGAKLNYQIESFIGAGAKKEMLAAILAGKSTLGPPALLLTGTHGMAFSKDDERQAARQGALVCDNWSGYGSIKETDYFTADDVPTDAKINGLIHFLFACYGGGCPAFDDFPEKVDGPPKQIAPKPFLSRLPQKLLAHPNGGALAVFGHVDRAWSLSFYSSRAGAQLQGFREVIGRILRGDRVGQATDQFDVRRGALASELADLQREIQIFKKVVADAEIARLWIARNDARDYLLLGDPAVRLRVDDLHEGQ